MPGRGGDELLAWWLGCFYKEKANWLEDNPLHGENLPSFGLWSVKKHLFLSVPALLMLSALRFIYSGSGCLGRCPEAGSLQWKGLLFAVPPAQG